MVSETQHHGRQHKMRCIPRSPRRPPELVVLAARHHSTRLEATGLTRSSEKVWVAAESLKPPCRDKAGMPLQALRPRHA